MTGHVYLANVGDGLTKIGFSRNCAARMQQLGATKGFLLSFPGSVAHERELHRLLKPYRAYDVEGRETFRLPPAVLEDLLESLRQQHSVTEKVERVRKVVVRLPVALYKDLRLLTIERDMSLHELMLEAVRDVISRRKYHEHS